MFQSWFLELELVVVVQFYFARGSFVLRVGRPLPNNSTFDRIRLKKPANCELHRYISSNYLQNTGNLQKMAICSCWRMCLVCTGHASNFRFRPIRRMPEFCPETGREPLPAALREHLSQGRRARCRNRYRGPRRRIGRHIRRRRRVWDSGGLLR